jgi:hypothetical protein
MTALKWQRKRQATARSSLGVLTGGGRQPGESEEKISTGARRQPARLDNKTAATQKMTIAAAGMRRAGAAKNRPEYSEVAPIIAFRGGQPSTSRDQVEERSRLGNMNLTSNCNQLSAEMLTRGNAR